MLYLAIPAQNEVATIGVLLWRLRTVLAEFPREYEVVVYDDASSDETADVAEQYTHAMPVTVLRGTTPVGYAGAVDALVRHIAAQTRYPRRDAMLLLQGDFTDPPGIVPEFARRFEGGADLVVGERTAVVDAPKQVRRLFAAANLALRPFVRVPGVRDLTGSMRLVRISALRDLLRTVGDAPVCEGDSWTANADLLIRLLPHARRVESVPVEPTYGVRTRETRRVTVRDALATLRWGWRARKRGNEPAAPDDATAESTRRPARTTAAPRRRDEPELTAEHLRERSRERHRLRGDSDAPATARDHRGERDRARSARTSESRSESRPESRPDTRREVAPDTRKPRRDESRDAAPVAKVPRPTSDTRRSRPTPPVETDDLLFDDPFAGPARASAQRQPPSTPILPVVSPDIAQPVAPAPETGSSEPRSPESRSPAKRGAYVDDDIGDRDDDNFDDHTGDDPASVDGAVDSAEASAEDSADDTQESAETRERKRRRNRRSRRRKSRQRRGASSTDDAADSDADGDGDGGDGDGDAATQSDSGESRNAEGDRTRSRSRRRSTPKGGADNPDAGSGAGNNADDAADSARDDADSDNADDTGGANAEGTRSSRARRRGRRGRRGGNRRKSNREDGATDENRSVGEPDDQSRNANDHGRPDADSSPYRDAVDRPSGDTD